MSETSKAPARATSPPANTSKENAKQGAANGAKKTLPPSAELIVHRFMQTLAPHKGCQSNDCQMPDEGITLVGALMCSVMLLNSVIERNGNRITESQGLTLPQWLALGCAAHGGEDGVSHSDIGRHLMLSKAPITGVVDRLERAALVERRADAKDRRVSRVVATAKGVEVWGAVKASLHDHTHNRMGLFMSEAEQEQLLRLLGQMLEAFSDDDTGMFALAGEALAGETES